MHHQPDLLRRGVIADWIAEVRRRGTALPIWIGLPGTVDYAKLVRISMKIGLGESARFLRHHSNWMSRLMTRQFKPDPLLRGLAPTLADPAARRRLPPLHVQRGRAHRALAARGARAARRPPVAVRAAFASALLRAEVREHRQHPAMPVRAGGQVELAEDGCDVALQGVLAMPRSVAIARLDRPSAMPASASSSRALSSSRGPPGRRRSSIWATTSGSSAEPPRATCRTASTKLTGSMTRCLRR